MNVSKFAVLAAAVFVLIAAAPSSDERRKQIRSLHWSVAPQHLDQSSSTLTVPTYAIAIRGADAQAFAKLANGSEDPQTEAVVADLNTGNLVYLDYHDAGYVTVDDWTNVNANEMLKSISETTEAGNADKKARGIAPLHVIGWLRAPTFDRTTKTVRWAINARDDSKNEPIVNSVALVLGRHGYEELTWVSKQSEYRPHGGMLDRVLRGDRFNPGARYQDFISGDKLAGYGIAALVGTAAGATIAKTVGFTGLLLLIKKLWFLIVAGVIGAYRWVRGRIKPNASV